MTQPRTVRRSGLALALAVTATSLGAGFGMNDDPVVDWAAQVWSAAKDGEGAAVERLLESLPMEATEKDPLKARTAGEMTRGLAQLREQRIEAETARDGERAEALDRMREAVAEDNRSLALREAVIVVIICDRGDRYLSTGVFPAQ